MPTKPITICKNAMDSPTAQQTQTGLNGEELAQEIKAWGQELGFQQVGITDVNMAEHGERLQEWLKKNYHGQTISARLDGFSRS